MSPATTARRTIVTFLVLTFAASAVFWLLIWQAGDLRAHGGLLTFGVMWCPGLAAILTTLIYQRNLKGLFGHPRPRTTMLLGYAVPLVYSTLVYGLAWAAGLALFTTQNLPPDQTLPSFIEETAFVGFFIALGSAIGEELGWRGLLAPQLAKITSYTKTSIISAIIHIIWHMPLILFANYRSSTPVWFAAACFAVMVTGLTFGFVWLRLRSGSFWPAAAMHASHNNFVQVLFTTLTAPVAVTPWVVGEFGIGMALAGVALGLAFWKVGLPAGPQAEVAATI